MHISSALGTGPAGTAVRTRCCAQTQKQAVFRQQAGSKQAAPYFSGNKQAAPHLLRSVHLHMCASPIAHAPATIHMCTIHMCTYRQGSSDTISYLEVPSHLTPHTSTPRPTPHLAMLVQLVRRHAVQYAPYPPHFHIPPHSTPFRARPACTSTRHPVCTCLTHPMAVARAA